MSMCSLEAVDDYGITSLFVAAQYGHHQCLEILANAGENISLMINPVQTSSSQSFASLFVHYMLWSTFTLATSDLSLLYPHCYFTVTHSSEADKEFDVRVNDMPLIFVQIY